MNVLFTSGPFMTSWFGHSASEASVPQHCDPWCVPELSLLQSCDSFSLFGRHMERRQGKTCPWWYLSQNLIQTEQRWSLDELLVHPVQNIFRNNWIWMVDDSEMLDHNHSFLTSPYKPTQNQSRNNDAKPGYFEPSRLIFWETFSCPRNICGK